MELAETIGRVERLFNEITAREPIEKKVVEMLVESYGSTKEQYYAAKQLAWGVLKAIRWGQAEENGDYLETEIKEDGGPFGEITVDVKWRKRPSGDDDVRGSRAADENGKTKIMLTIDTPLNDQTELNIVSTLAHEIMHCLQAGLKKVKGISEQSLTIYNCLPTFFSNAPTDFSRNFFYGLYACFAIEANANVSSIWNYVSAYFEKQMKRTGKGKEQITTEEIKKVLHTNPKYTLYVDIAEILNNVNPTVIDKEYITKCLCQPLFNPYSEKHVSLYDKKTFNVDAFISKNRTKIINVCEKTLKRMDKAVISFFENKKSDS